jgi:hypothetical protein
MTRTRTSWIRRGQASLESPLAVHNRAIRCSREVYAEVVVDESGIEPLVCIEVQHLSVRDDAPRPSGKRTASPIRIEFEAAKEGAAAGAPSLRDLFLQGPGAKTNHTM